ncbi:uncharacterized protein LOC120418762 [Culex pipiens pallens]|uniref:uncharacterized protein LOC120418762 n=1 Tax=Culex pipiens pallens TaxID=42434 RepID=UPI001952A4BD|nr:uncharacterized protein LOC120418762 [Culex pipiens pallens]
MEVKHMLSQYYGMNASHLTIDEFSHELHIRKLPLDGARSQLEKVLYNHLKQERKQLNVSYEFVSDSVDEELGVCEDKLDFIKNHLETSRAAKAPGQVYKTRLIHMLFRMERLRKHITENADLDRLAVVAVEIVRLLSVYYSIVSPIPEVRAAEWELINQSITVAKKQLEENTPGDENGSGGDGTEKSDQTGALVERRESDKRTAGDDGEEKQKLVDQNQELRLAVSALLQRIETLELKQPEKDPATAANSTQIASNENGKQSGETGKAEPDFFMWLKEKVGSLDNSRDSEQNNKEKPKSKPEQSSVNEKLKDNRNRLPVHKWTVRYDGMDNGRRLNEFLKEVEFNARSEGFSEAELFQCAHHLFTHKARSWFMEVNGNNELGTWRRMVKELKNEFLPIDIDYVYERQVYNRKQGAREKFHDFYLDMARIFRNMSQPWDEKRKFDSLFRNTREDCQIAMLAANIQDITAMKEFGKRFDSINWQLYKRKENKFTPRTAHVEEVGELRRPYGGNGNGNRFQNNNQDGRGYYQQQKPQVKGFQKGNWNQRPPKQEQQQYQQRNQQFHHQPKNREQSQREEKAKPKQDNQQRPKSPVQGPSGTDPLQRIVRAYIPIKRGVCYNCHEEGHGFSECPKNRNVFCERCGFPGFDTRTCPFCESKNLQRTAQ